MQELNLNLHDLVRIWSPAVSPNVYNGIHRLLGHFYVDQRPPEELIDVAIVPLQADSSLHEPLSRILPSPYGMSFVEHRGENGIVFNYRGRPDLVLMLGKRITINYTPRKKNVNRIYGLILFTINLVLHQKMGLLYHGAAVARDDVALLLTGLRGAKKTHVLMELLSKGWDYISDDKMLIQGGRMYTFQDIIPIADHHLVGIPWIYDLLPEETREQKCAWRRNLRSHAAAASRRWLPKHFLPIAEKFYDPHHIVSVRQLFPQCRIIQSAVPTAVILLSLGDKIACEEIYSEDVLEEITAIQSLVFYSMGPLEQLVYFCNRSFQVSLGDVVRENIVRANLAQFRFLRLTIPGRADMSEVYDALMKQVHAGARRELMTT